MENREPALIRAAGGLVWRQGDGGREILLVHRPRYDDWSLPKGKLLEGERWQAAALREVCEETGYTARLEGFAGVAFYYVEGTPKLVLFWNMSPVEGHPSAREAAKEEVDAWAWLSAGQALARMDYPEERALVAQEAED
jgi:8-oxo-dGTP diphosphatase